MKLKTIALGLLATVAAAPSLLADVNIYLTGSTAFRSAVITTVAAMYDAGATVNADNSPASKANHATYSGTMTALYGGQIVNVYMSWSGSVEGVQAVTAGANQSFLPVGNVLNTTNNNYSVSTPADFALSDVFQSTTPYSSPVLNQATVSGAPGIGVVPFTFMHNNSTAANSITNITHQQAITLLANGQMSLRFWTGSSSDQGTMVSLVGRYPLSGTRYTIQADTGYGARSVSDLWELIGGVWTDVGDAGYSSGGSVATDLGATVNNGPAIGYLGTSDAATAAGLGATYISYEGVPYSVTAVTEGTYSLWGYEHLYWKGTLDANHTTFKNAFATNIQSNFGVAGIAISLMKVSRGGDGGAIGTLY